MVMKVTVCLAIFLIVPVTQKGFLTFCTGKVLYMPIFPHGSDNSLFNWSPVIYKKCSIINIFKEFVYLQAPQIGMFILSWHLKQ